MTHFTLIHGSWHGAWCWYKVAPRLRDLGHEADAVELPGRGRSPARAHFISLDTMVKSVERFLPLGRKTTVVVHSRYGVLASLLAERVPDRIERTIYLASFMMPNRKAVAHYFRSDRDSWLAPHVEINRLGMWDRLDPSAYRETLYHDCNDDDNALAAFLLCREPLRPAIAKLTLSDGNYGRVPRSYIRLTEDRAVSLSLQDRLIEETGVDRVESIQASHSAYFSKPDELAATIVKLSQS